MNNIPTFGTDGIRGNAQSPQFSSPAIHALGKALVCWLQKEGILEPKILVGMDTRLSSNRIRHALMAGIVAQGGVPIDGGVLPTPVVMFQVANTGRYDCGVVVSASHNVYSDNGIKVVGPRGKISTHAEHRITRQLRRFMRKKYFDASFKVTPLENNFALPLMPGMISEYLTHITTRFSANFLVNRKIVIDCANGAFFDLAPTLFKQFGAEVISKNITPNGLNINQACGSTHPTNLQAMVLANNADVGFAFDGDGDRVIMVSRSGEIKNGDDMLALLLTHPEYRRQRKIVGTIMSNLGLEQHLEAMHKKLLRTQVGDKFVCKTVKKERVLLGGERSGHLIVADHLYGADGLFAALLLLETAILTNNWDMKTFIHCPQELVNIAVTERYNLSAEPFVSILRRHQKKFSSGRFVVRFSGTENVLRIMAEHPDQKQTSLAAHLLAEELSSCLNNTTEILTEGSIYETAL